MFNQLNSPLQSVASLHHDSGATEHTAAIMGTGIGVSAQFNNDANQTGPVAPEAKFDGFDR